MERDLLRRSTLLAGEVDDKLDVLLQVLREEPSFHFPLEGGECGVKTVSVWC